MATIVIKDLSENIELDRQAMLAKKLTHAETHLKDLKTCRE